MTVANSRQRAANSAAVNVVPSSKWRTDEDRSKREITSTTISVACRFVRHDGEMFLGDDLLAWLALALGGALFAGNLLAVVKPPDEQRDESNLERAPVGRSLLYAGLGFIVAVWALATLVSG